MLNSKIIVKLPDGLEYSFDKGITALDIAKNIGKEFAKNLIAVRVQGRLYDLNSPLTENVEFHWITKLHTEGLEILRHSASHIMAEAVKELYPETQITVGPSIQDGFYYDFYRNISFSSKDLIFIEKRMKEIVLRDEKIIREVWTRDFAISYFKEQGETFKVKIIQDLIDSKEVTIYRQGKFIDLCRGPHLSSTSYLGNDFKLMRISGAYWKGDSKNYMLQRIYGTIWRTKKELRLYLHRLSEADKRDHRKIGEKIGLFHQQEESMGNVFWHDKGWILYRTIKNYIRSRLENENYKEVKTPQMLDRSLWEKSGHWDKFRDAMFTINVDGGRTLAIKPMNCPCHVQIFNKGLKSYRDLPLRMAEFGSCHRNEPSGSLHGLFRMRSFVQDDAHIFCTEKQIISETKEFCRLLISVYKDFGFFQNDIKIKFSDRPNLRAGEDDVWDKAESSLVQAVQESGLNYEMNSGEGAFYGPKLEFVLKDAIGRDWQCGTLQVDFVLPDRLSVNYIAKNSAKHRTVMLHRAILGSLERFIAILIEHYSGNLPLWLSPVQVVVSTITNDINSYAYYIMDILKKIGIRAIVDLRNEKISYKIRTFSIQKIPIIIVVGKEEMKKSRVTVRLLGCKNQENIALNKWVDRIRKESLPFSKRGF